MSNKTVVIGDIAGQYDALMRLVARLPKDAEIVLVGDLNDRGPKSKEVIEWAMTTPNVTTVHSNHGDLFVDSYRSVMDADYQHVYDRLDFYRNGGMETLKSYGASPFEMWKVDRKHIEWLASRPVYHVTEGLLISHAPVPIGLPTVVESDFSPTIRRWLVWNREKPKPIPGLVQVFGHNAHWGVKPFIDKGGTWGLCVDGSRKKRLSAFIWAENAVIQEPYQIKEKKK